MIQSKQFFQFLDFSRNFSYKKVTFSILDKISDSLFTFMVFAIENFVDFSKFQAKNEFSTF